MVVCDLDVVGIVTLPPEANPKLIVDSDTVLASSIASQSFRAVSWRNCKLREFPHPVDLVKLAASHRPQFRWTHPSRSGAIDSIKDVLDRPVAEGAYHEVHYND